MAVGVGFVGSRLGNTASNAICFSPSSCGRTRYCTRRAGPNLTLSIGHASRGSSPINQVLWRLRPPDGESFVGNGVTVACKILARNARPISPDNRLPDFPLRHSQRGRRLRSLFAYALHLWKREQVLGMSVVVRLDRQTGQSFAGVQPYPQQGCISSEQLLQPPVATGKTPTYKRKLGSHRGRNRTATSVPRGADTTVPLGSHKPPNQTA
jgi:hypothetical protein